MRAFTSKGRRAAPCFDTRPASGCQGFFLSQSSINIRLNKQKGIYPETSRLLLFINQSTTKQFPLHYSSLHHRNKRKTPAQKCPTLCSLTDWSPPSSSVHGTSQARILEWATISFSRGCSLPRHRSHIAFVLRLLHNHSHSF